MKGTKTQKGITLIALIITIVVLMILAVVTINSVKDGGIIQHAQNAATAYNKAQTDEATALQGYIDYIEKSQQQIGQVSYNGTPLAIGDFVKVGDDYYIVLYNDDTEGLQIISTQIKETVTLTGIEGFENRIQTLNNAALKYKGNVLGAIDARVPGYTFNEIKNIELKTPIELTKSDGTAVEVKIYGRASGTVSAEGDNCQTALTAALTNGLGNGLTSNFWRSTYYNPVGYIGAEYVDVADNYNSKTAALVEYNSDTKVLTAENSVTNSILPVFLLDQRIEITGGTGTYADPYVYEF